MYNFVVNFAKKLIKEHVARQLLISIDYRVSTLRDSFHTPFSSLSMDNNLIKPIPGNCRTLEKNVKK